MSQDNHLSPARQMKQRAASGGRRADAVFGLRHGLAWGIRRVLPERESKFIRVWVEDESPCRIEEEILEIPLCGNPDLKDLTRGWEVKGKKVPSLGTQSNYNLRHEI
ncbi:hypothetical protein E2C01_011857 [Portunus trituberculatus]|uniref:Uncharacterized protein n=1 Tax=Portunus trituberculatus TaxID=210409 RepID=A0A5B7DCL3_PORTR|nr:hypothetical protein [Portunus trituberculatus]